MGIKGKIVNGKFVDETGKYYKVIPPGAEIMEMDGTVTPSPTKANTNKPQAFGTKHTGQILPKCVSIEIREATQTKEGAKIIIRAHCRDHYADAVADHWFTGGPDARIGIMQKIQAEAVQSAQLLLNQLMNVENQVQGDESK